MDYPMTALNFKVGWGDSTSSFSEVSGLTMETETVEYRGGAHPEQTVRKMPGLRKYGSVTLKRGIVPAAGNGLFAWFDQVQSGGDFRRVVTVSLCNEQQEIVMTWTMKSAWPVKLEGPGLKGTGTDVAIESLEFAHEGITVTIP
ncbi:phage tail protein [Streptomyces sp. NPDC005017]|uniref:phage tail protein n=1 Tax=Streptomyces sp. NPDC005017 TaxID=3364706 RepID=UPI0036A219E8